MKQPIALVMMLAVTPAGAHEKGDRAMGVVETVSAQEIVIKSADGHLVAFKITDDTRFVRGDEPVRLDDVTRGQRAVVHGKRVGEALPVRPAAGGRPYGTP